MKNRIISFTLALTFLIVLAMNVSAESINSNMVISIDDIHIVEPDKQILTHSNIDDDFADDSIIVILTTDASKTNKDFTAKDFPNIGVSDIEDVTRLSDREYHQVKPAWSAQEHLKSVMKKEKLNNDVKKRRASLEMTEAFMQYEEAKKTAEQTTLVDVEQFRRILILKLNEHSKENVMEAIKKLETRNDIHYVGPNYISGIAIESAVINDPRKDEQWAINKIDLPNAWDVTTGDSTIKVGVIDSGINGSHEDLANHIDTQLSCDYAENTNGLIDALGHGTHVAGIIGAEANNGLGVAGVNWDVSLVSLKVLNSSGNWGSNGRSAVAMAVNHARVNNIPILNASLVIGYDNEENQPIRDAVAGYTGIFVQSAGNYGQNTDNNARFEGFSNVIVVGSTDQNDNISTFSNWGSTSVHLFAPGTDILSTYNNSYYSLSGTSMAAPHVAGVLALMAAQYPSLSMEQHRAALLSGVDIIPQLSGLATTGGRLNAYKALNEAGADTPVYIEATAGTGGTVTGGGIYEYGDNVTLTAIPDEGYDFIGWYENDIRINDAAAIYSFVAEDYRRLEARFMQETGSDTPVYIMVTAGEGGTVIGGGTYFYGNIVELTAIPNTGYTFDGWYEDDVKIIGAGAAYSFIAEDFRMLEARFI